MARPAPSKTNRPGRTSKRLGTASIRRPEGRLGLARGRIVLMEKEFALAETVSPATNDEFLEGCRKGSLPSFEGLYQEHGARMESIAMNLTGNAADAEDAVQDTFLKVYRGLSRFRGGCAFSTWVYRILVNSCYDLMRRNRRRVERPLSAKAALPPGSQTD